MGGVGLSGASIGLVMKSIMLKGDQWDSVWEGGYWVSVGTNAGYLVQWGSLGLSGAHCGVICSVGVSGTQ